ncbi:MAG: hypothetical protein RJA57_836 [Bacteroidota bacterium]
MIPMGRFPVRILCRTIAAILLITSCKQRQTAGPRTAPEPARLHSYFGQVHESAKLVRNGDLIFRNGTDEVSRAARSMNRKDTSFSHCGLLFIENDSVVVYHAIGGIYNPSQRLRREPIDSFCNPRENDAYGIYRFPLTAGQTDSLRHIVAGYYAAGLKFDLYFNFLSDDVMYCSEFVFKSLNRARQMRMSAYVRLDTLPYGVTTDDLFLHPESREVKKDRFSQ